MADDLRASIEAAMESVDVDKEIPNEPVIEPVVEVAPSESAVVTPAETSSVQEASAPSESATDTGSSADEKPPVASTVENAPASWKGEAKQVWADLPEAARNEVIRRETHVNRVLSENAEVRNYAGAIQEVTQRHQARIAEFGMPPAQVFDTLLEADRMLSTAEPLQRAQYMAKLIKDYAVDITALDNALSGAVPAVPDVSRQVQMQVDAALAPFRQQQQYEQAGRQQEVEQTIASMEDNPQFPQFDQVREEMADLIEIKANRGLYITLPQAYAMVTGGTTPAQQQVAAAKQVTATAQKAKAAAVSVGGTPISNSGGASSHDLRATIEAAIDGNRV